MTASFLRFTLRFKKISKKQILALMIAIPVGTCVNWLLDQKISLGPLVVLSLVFIVPALVSFKKV